MDKTTSKIQVTGLEVCHLHIWFQVSSSPQRWPCVVQRSALGSWSVMVWGGFTTHNRTPLQVIDGAFTRVRNRSFRPRGMISHYSRTTVVLALHVLSHTSLDNRTSWGQLFRQIRLQANVCEIKWTSFAPTFKLTSDAGPTILPHSSCVVHVATLSRLCHS